MSKREILNFAQCPHKNIKYGFSGFYQTEETVCYMLPDLKIYVCAVCMDCGLRGPWDKKAKDFSLPSPHRLRQALNRFYHEANYQSKLAVKILNDETFMTELKIKAEKNCGRRLALMDCKEFKRS